MYVITWETKFGEFPNSSFETTIPTRRYAPDTSSGLANDASTPDDIFTDVDLSSTEPHEKDGSDLTEEIHSDRTNGIIDDQQSSEGSDTIVPEVLDDDDMNVENERKKI